MIQPDPVPLCLSQTPAAVVAPRVALRAYLALVAACGGLLTGGMLMMSVVSNSGAEAERIALTQDDSYAATLVAALSVDFAKPLR
ncbi:hypothetical protein SAMN05216360_106240 [Methylobacterium phyllostachyos]|uniref:Uncharacterized protein n=1 Tax=Methylobacterium phyllostachyos TaxID=582672 RepID=A0A1G9ZEX8_9HYPH|nr:hypothetical protein [Methylobacterium phyllostachyos]SDN19725.1 hypothetical protein SAMN05216360_106240 [Methylobacterium phyllostachyos]